MTRAKFVVESRTEVTSGFQIKLRAVTRTTEENEKFFKFTPSGSLEMGIVNPETAKQFAPGKEFYLDFTEAEV